MSVPYIPKITTGGQNAAITARENGFAFEVTHVSFGTGLYVHTGNEIALQNEIAKVPIAGGGRVAGMLSLVINTLLKDSDLYVGVNQPVDISEIGFWNEGVLFAIYANNTVLVRKIQDCYIANVYTLALKTLQPIDAANINVVIDEGAAVVLALLGEHLSVTNPHPQYATVLMLQDEALTREQNDLALSIAIAAEITNRENADNGLSGQIAQEVLDRQAGDTAEATARENGDLALAVALAAEITNRENAFNNLSSQLSHSFYAHYGYNKEQDYLNTLKIKAHTDVLIFASAGGGGGGGQGGVNGSFNAGTDGSNTKVIISKEALTGSITSPTNSPSKFTSTLLEGGKHGTGGYRYNGNTGNHQIGESGDDGDYVVYLVNNSISSEMRSVLSVILESNPTPAQGAANDANASPVTQFKRYKFNLAATDNAYLDFQESGKGGNGKYTPAGNLSGNSGHGGHGAKVLLHIKNMGTTDMYLSFRVGAKGDGGTGDYANGDDGTDGSILILGAIPA